MLQSIWDAQDEMCDYLRCDARIVNSDLYNLPLSVTVNEFFKKLLNMTNIRWLNFSDHAIVAERVNYMHRRGYCKSNWSSREWDKAKENYKQEANENAKQKTVIPLSDDRGEAVQTDLFTVTY